MVSIPSPVIVGITLGSIYTLMALGLNLVYGVTRVFNYAQGAFFTWGAYLAWLFTVGRFNLPFGLAIPLTLVIMFSFGVAFERAAIRPLRRLPNWQWSAFLLGLGFTLVLDNVALLVFGSRNKTLPYLLEGTFTFGGSVILKHNMLTFIAAIVIVIILTLFMNKVREGMCLRAVAQDPMGAQITGLNINRSYSLSFGLSALLGAISGILLAPRTLIYPFVGWPVLIKAFVVMVFGGLGSFSGTLIAAFTMGVAEAVVTYYIGSTWGLPIFLVILSIVLIFRPRGLLGKWA